MSEPAFTTRAEAGAPPVQLVRLMAKAAYEAGRPAGSGRPAWEDTTAEWQDAMHREMTAAPARRRSRRLQGRRAMSLCAASPMWPDAPGAWPAPQSRGRRLIDDCRPTDSQLTWFGLRAATRRETTAEEGLVDGGFAVYLPRLIRWRRTSRNKIRVEGPLFPGYMFVGLGERQDLADATAVEGVHQAVSFSKSADPVPIQFADLLDVLTRERDGEFDKTRRDRRKDPVAGTKVDIVGGRFKGFPAEFVHRRDDERIEVMFTLFGRSNPLVLKPEEVGGVADESDD